MPDVLAFLQIIPIESLTLFWIATVLIGYIVGDAVGSMTKGPQSYGDILNSIRPKERHTHRGGNGKFAKRSEG